MNRQYTITEAQSLFVQIIDEVENGATVEVTRKGQPVVEVVPSPVRANEENGGNDFGKKLTEFLANPEFQGVGLEDRDLEGLRDQSPGR
jgi:prevent-host-death family protein